MTKKRYPKAYTNDPIKLRIYNSYRNIRQCAFNPNNDSYRRATAAGAELDCEWDTFSEFYEWVMHKLGPAPFPRARLVRKNQNKPWNSRNIEWNTHKTQGERLRNCHQIRYQGKTQTMAQWSEELGLSIHTVYGRWGRGVRKPSLLLSKEKIGC